MQEHLHKHFKSEWHTEFVNGVSIALIDKTDSFNPTKKENYWMQTLSLGKGCQARRDVSLVGHLHDLDFGKYLRHAIWTRFDFF